MLRLATDTIPNIRFNVAKALEVISVVFNETPEGREIVEKEIIPVLKGFQADNDADVRYFATKALEKSATL